MPLLGLELNDTGILVAGGTPEQLLDVETGGKELSPEPGIDEGSFIIFQIFIKSSSFIFRILS